MGLRMLDKNLFLAFPYKELIILLFGSAPYMVKPDNPLLIW